LGNPAAELLAHHVRQPLESQVVPTSMTFEAAVFDDLRGSMPLGLQTGEPREKGIFAGLTQEAVVRAFLLDLRQSEVAHARLEAWEAEASLATCLAALSEASSALASAVDAYAAALDELQTSGPGQLRKLGTLTDPPLFPRLACEAAFVLLRLEPRPASQPGTDSWAAACELLLDGSFLQLLLGYDKEHADPEAVRAVRRRYLAALEKLRPDSAGTSPAADLLRAWLGSAEAHHAAAVRTAAAREAVKAARKKTAVAAEALAGREASLREALVGMEMLSRL